MKTKPLDEPIAFDVALALQTYREFYDLTEQLRVNYAKKIKKGIFHRSLAIKGYAAWVQYALKTPWFKKYYCDVTLSPATRTLCAEYLLDHYMEEIEEMSSEFTD